MLFYNHYYDDVRFVHAPGLGVMWKLGNPNGPTQDYIKIKIKIDKYTE